MKVGDRVICTDRDCRVLIPGNEYLVFEVDSNFPKPRCKVSGEFQCGIATTSAWFEQRHFEIHTKLVSKLIGWSENVIRMLAANDSQSTESDTEWVSKRTDETLSGITDLFTDVFETAANDSELYDEDDSPGQKQFDDKRKKRDLDRIDAGIAKEEEKDRKAETVSNAIDKTLNRKFLGWINYLG